MNSIFIVREFKEGVEGGGAGRWGYKIQKVLFAIPCCKLPLYKKKLPALTVCIFGVFFYSVYVCMHGYKGHVQVAV